MRFHVGRNAPNTKGGWIRKGKGQAYTVKLDGRVITDVVAADEEEGVVWVRPAPVIPGTLPSRLMGKVEIEVGVEHFHDQAAKASTRRKAFRA